MSQPTTKQMEAACDAMTTALYAAPRDKGEKVVETLRALEDGDGDIHITHSVLLAWLKDDVLAHLDF